MRQSNIDVIKDFSNGLQAKSWTGNLYTVGGKLYNYSTVIAINTYNGVILNARKYSATTSKIQTYIRRYCNVVQEVDNENKLLSLYN